MCCFLQETDPVQQKKCSTLNMVQFILSRQYFHTNPTLAVLFVLMFVLIAFIVFLSVKFFLICCETLRFKTLLEESSDATLNRNVFHTNRFQSVFSLGQDTLQVFEPYNANQLETHLAMPPSYEECCIICANKELDLKY